MLYAVCSPVPAVGVPNVTINRHECVLHVIFNCDHQREITARCISADDGIGITSELRHLSSVVLRLCPLKNRTKNLSASFCCCITVAVNPYLSCVCVCVKCKEMVYLMTHYRPTDLQSINNCKSLLLIDYLHLHLIAALMSIIL